MMKDLIAIKVSLIILLLSSSVYAEESFRSAGDKQIVYSVLDNFSKNCGIIMTLQDRILFSLEKKFKEAQEKKQKDALFCYRQNLSKVKSVHFIYQSICKDLTQDGIPFSEESVMRLFVSSRLYRKGILVPHSVLNDCLVGRNVEPQYIVEVYNGKKEFNLLVSKLKRLKRKNDFISTRVNFK